jgi:ParB/RepB/Spo0J family partition protein
MARRNSVYGISPHTPQFVELPIESIQPNPHQPRKTVNEETIDRLAKSIEREGLHQPIVVIRTDDPDVYILGAGQRRLLAHIKLERQTIPAMIAKTDNPAEIALTENLQREDLHPMDAAEAMAGLMTDYEYTQEQLGEFLGERRSTVTEWLSINTLPDQVKEQCRALDLRKTHLVALARLADQPDELRAALDRIGSGDRISTRELQSRQRGRQAPARPADVPKALLPVIRAIETTHRVRDQLAKIKPSSIITSHPDELTELRELHKEIGGLIRKLEKGGDKQTPKARGTKDARSPEATDDAGEEREPEEAQE